MDYDKLSPIVSDVSAKLARAYPGIDSEDISQEIWLQLVGKRDLIDFYNTEYVAKVAWNSGKEYCNRERYDYMMSTSQFVYSVDEVQKVLEEAFFDISSWLAMPSEEYDATAVDAGGMWAPLRDIGEAFLMLRTADQSVIRKRCTTDQPLTDAERMRYRRAVDKLAEFCNGDLVARMHEAREYDGPGARRAMTNARAQYETKEIF